MRIIVMLVILFAGAGSPVLAHPAKASHNIIQKSNLKKPLTDGHDDLVGGIINLVRTGIQIVDRTGGDGIASGAAFSFLSANSDDILSLIIEGGSTYHLLLLYPHHKFW